MQPLISVIVPLWQPWEATEKLWKSLRRQTIPYELISVCGSRGAPAARNAGATKARGAYLFFCDQDTKLEPACLASMMNALRSHASAGYAYCDYARKGALTGFHRSRPFDAALLSFQNYIDTCSLMRRSVFPGFDEHLGRLQDWDVWLTLLERGVTGIYIPRILYTKHYRPGDISLRDNYRQWREIVSRKHHAAFRAPRNDSFFCPVCERTVASFLPGGPRLRPGARCPHCGSLERHRLSWLYFQHKTTVLEQRCAFLHIAPEPSILRRFLAMSYIHYVPADLHPRHPSVHRMDISAISHPNNSFDFIYASHVLEHVADDRGAIREFHRVLKPGGVAIIMVPIAGTRTTEGGITMQPPERLRMFGQEDHLRQYGADFADRLREVGWDVTCEAFAATLSDQEILRYGLRRDEHIYLCTK